MELIAEEILTRFVEPLWSPGLFIVAAAIVGMLVTGLAARITELGESIADRFAG